MVRDCVAVCSWSCSLLNGVVEFVVVVFGLVCFLLFCVLGLRVVLLCIGVVGVLLQPCLGLLYTYSCS